MKTKKDGEKATKKARDIMTQDPACCTPDISLKDAAWKMWDLDCGEIPVLDAQGKPIGVITDRDITCRTVAMGKNPLLLKVSDCMTRECFTVSEESTLQECCDVMEGHKVRRVPVVDQEGRCCGMISLADIALKAPQEKSAGILHEVSRES